MGQTTSAKFPFEKVQNHVDEVYSVRHLGEWWGSLGFWALVLQRPYSWAQRHFETEKRVNIKIARGWRSFTITLFSQGAVQDVFNHLGLDCEHRVVPSKVSSLIVDDEIVHLEDAVFMSIDRWAKILKIKPWQIANAVAGYKKTWRVWGVKGKGVLSFVPRSTIEKVYGHVEGLKGSSLKRR